ncbi:DUF1653 domain-containing protein [Tannockella kyphosi]|uniref:DUF1653 domain-containing protein n=1 Tax=Tannockella kyphosi TaxID=2899121 RepID=UPI002011F152|nr:DUF1653 domain-containing protein [Tannockella kyphosi]
MERKLYINRLYRHFKGMLYYVVEEGLDSETLEPVVIYRQLYGEYKTFVRNKEMFLSLVDKQKYPEVEAMYRFTLVEE